MPNYVRENSARIAPWLARNFFLVQQATFLPATPAVFRVTLTAVGGDAECYGGRGHGGGRDCIVPLGPSGTMHGR